MFVQIILRGISVLAAVLDQLHLTKVIIAIFIILAIVLPSLRRLPIFTQPASNTSLMLSHHLSADSSSWTPISGAWLAEGTSYKHKEVGEIFTARSATLLINDDFSGPDIATIDTVFTDTFTGPNGPPNQWSQIREGFTIANNVYSSTSVTQALSIPAFSKLSEQTDYEIRAKVRRNGTADAFGYSILFFRLTMADATNDSSYALLLRQTGLLQLYKRTNGDYTAELARVSILKDNEWHGIIVQVIQSSIKIWFDKDKNELPDIAILDSSYSTGTIGVGTNGWSSDFDDIQVEAISTLSCRWQDKRGGFHVGDGVYHAIKSSTKNSLSIVPNNSSQSWSDYRITARLKMGGTVGTSDYAIIYFRTTMQTTASENAYALLIRLDGKLQLLKVNDGWASYSFLGPIANIYQDNNWHDVVIRVTGTIARVWFDRDETEVPNFEYPDLIDYPVGTVGVGTSSGTNSSFGNFKVENILSIEAAPSHLYAGSNSATTLTIRSSINLDNIQLTAANPSGTTWAIGDPSGCSGSRSCSVIFPTAFSHARVDMRGTYVISAINWPDASKLLLEVRERPLLAFVVITDTHISDEQARLDQLSHTVSDINRSKHFPLPDFVVLTGDLTESGSSVELSAIKSALDKLDVTYYPITGNHDSDSESGEEKGHLWASIFGNNRFSYSWVNSDFLFLAMDVNTPYGGYGYKLNNSAHNTWLQNLLNSNPDKFVFLFSHYSLNGNRDGGAAKFHWETDGSEMMAILESHANVVAQFAGHNHLFGTSKFNGVSYITTGAFNANDSYRYIEVYVDRTECHVLKNLFYRYNYAGNTWPGSTDTTHTVSTYSFGLPMERQFKIHHKSKTNDILDAISVVGNASWTNLSYKADITLGEEDFLGKNVAGLVFRYNDPDNYYSVLLDSADNKIELQMKHNGVVTELASMPILIDVNTKYTMKVSAIGKGIKVYLNNALTISVSDATFVSGTVGVRSYLAPTSFDNITTSDPLSRFR